MYLIKILIRGAALLGAFVMITGLAQASSPELLVVNRGDNSLAFVDLQSGKVVGSVPTGEGAHGVAVSTDGKLAFVTNTYTKGGGPSISVIDVAARKELRRVKMGPYSRPHGIAFAGGKVYFTAEGYKEIGCYDPAADRIEWFLGNGQERSTLIVVSKDTQKIFVGNHGSDTVSIMERTAEPAKWEETVGWTVTTIPVGKEPHGIDFTPDGKEVWTAHMGDSRVSVIDVASDKVKETFDAHTNGAARLKFTLDGKRVLILDDDGLIVMDRVTRKEVKRIPVGKHPQEILMAPDGSVAYLSIAGNGDVAILDLKTLEIKGRIPTGKSPEGLALVASN